MAKVSSIQKNEHRRQLADKMSKRRDALKKVIYSRTLSIEERIAATLKLAEMPRNSSRTRFRNRCLLTGRARGFYRKFGVSRIAIRELGSQGLLPGVTKSSW